MGALQRLRGMAGSITSALRSAPKKPPRYGAGFGIGGYEGAGYRERIAYWQPGNADADGSSVSDLRELRNRSRDLIRNAPIATGAIETSVTHVVGTGLSLQSRIDATALGMSEDQARAWQTQAEREWRLWCESTYCDTTREQDFYELQELAFRSFLESGDVFVLLPEVEEVGWPYRLTAQVIEADRISNENGKADTAECAQGIERNARGAPFAAWIADRHPGQRTVGGPAKWTRVPFRGESGRVNLLHLKRKLRPGQTRGIPALAPIVSLLKQLERFSNAEVDAAVNSAAMAVFVKMDPVAFGDLFTESSQASLVQDAQRWDGTLKAGAAVNLLPGEEIQSPTPGRPNPEFEPFFAAIVKQIGVALNVPFEVLMKHFNASYSASRAALLDAWRTFRKWRAWLASKLCQPIYEELLAEAILSGRIAAPGFFADPSIRKAWCGSAWNGDGPGSIDPAKEAEAAEKRMDIGLTSLAEEKVAYDGGDWESTLRQREQEVSARKAAGVVPEPKAMPQPPAEPTPAPAAVQFLMPSGFEMPAPIVHYNPPAITVNVPETVVHYQPPVINLPEPVVHYTPPQITVDAPVINLPAPVVTVEAAAIPEQKPPVVISAPAARRGRVSMVANFHPETGRLIGATFEPEEITP